MKRNWRWFLVPLIFGIVITPLILVIRFYVIHIQWFNSAGTIARKEHELMIVAVSLMLLVILPVIGLMFLFVWWYRADNKKALYLPNWDHAKTDELIWWSIPLEIVLVLAALTWSSTHTLDPWKPLISNTAPITVEVVALDWKWLFIYPNEGIATVNQLEVPVNTPINFELTADAPMNSFWIPKMGGQVMVMTGMVTQLHLDATQKGTFQGRSGNFSGDGFSGMQFDVRSVSNDDFNAWVKTVQNSGAKLDWVAYTGLVLPSEKDTPKAYVLGDPHLFENIVGKFMQPSDMPSMFDQEKDSVTNNNMPMTMPMHTNPSAAATATTTAATTMSATTVSASSTSHVATSSTMTMMMHATSSVSSSAAISGDMALPPITQ